jgi:hypothetical protein
VRGRVLSFQSPKPVDFHLFRRNFMSTASISNGKPRRKQLSEQLDRFDAMLDGLGEGLGEAVAEAARVGTRMAVKDAIVEILTDPQLRNQMHQATAPPADPVEAKPTLWGRFKAGMSRVGKAVRGGIEAMTNCVTGTAEAVCRAAQDPLRIVSMLGSVKRLLLLAGGVGAVVTLLSYLCPHCLSAAVSGLGAAATAVAVQIGVWARRAFRTFSPA